MLHTPSYTKHGRMSRWELVYAPLCNSRRMTWAVHFHPRRYPHPFGRAPQMRNEEGETVG